MECRLCDLVQTGTKVKDFGRYVIAVDGDKHYCIWKEHQNSNQLTTCKGLLHDMQFAFKRYIAGLSDKYIIDYFPMDGHLHWIAEKRND